ncbi:hypothetical protein KIN20_028384 [Parelaphostrongylus tenuis]|uniref:Gamma interferon inducible lysosomal thiol reductase n=1 Tax=Parelaphostrongylus tenuis TaxID=148309 RepID=A0AAD5R0R6_PARTN|nr:hypothetical protein KIN20_028384 [Parelaphostrongylus tenuis]
MNSLKWRYGWWNAYCFVRIRLLQVKDQMRRQMTRSGLRRYLYAAVTIVSIFLMYRWLSRHPKYSELYGHRGEIMSRTLPPKVNKVSLEIYMESKCPDTSRFMHKQLMKSWSMLSNTGRIELTMIPFGKARCVATAGDDYKCTCQHGKDECILNQLMNCVIERITVPDRTVPIIDCIQGRNNLNDAMTSCVSNNALLDHQWMRDCATGPTGRRLLAMAGARTVALKPALDFVPWIIIDGERNSDAYYDLTENLCKKLKPAPDECVVYMQNSQAQ